MRAPAIAGRAGTHEGRVRLAQQLLDVVRQTDHLAGSLGDDRWGYFDDGALLRLRHRVEDLANDLQRAAIARALAREEERRT